MPKNNKQPKNLVATKKSALATALTREEKDAMIEKIAKERKVVLERLSKT